MKTTEILTRHLRDDRPVWTICNLPKGFHDPLVVSGVLAWGGVLDEIDCDCQDCDSMPKPYIRDESAGVQQWAYTCEMTGEVINVDLDRISYWEYDADRFYVSHMKKIIDWYNDLIRFASLDFEEPQTESEEEQAN